MKIISFIPKEKTEKGSLIQDGTEGYTQGVEIEVQDKNSSTGKFYYTWSMPVYKDNNGEFNDIKDSHGGLTEEELTVPLIVIEK